MTDYTGRPYWHAIEEANARKFNRMLAAALPAYAGYQIAPYAVKAGYDYLADAISSTSSGFSGLLTRGVALPGNPPARLMGRRRRGRRFRRFRGRAGMKTRRHSRYGDKLDFLYC